MNGFGEWLAGQADRTDGVGDLARDWVEDREDGCGLEVRSAVDLRAHLAAKHQGGGSVEYVLDQAEREYRR